MQSGPKDAWNSRVAPKEPGAHPVYGQVQRFLAFVVNERSEELSEITAANKRKLCDEILSDVAENVAQAEPILAVRRRLTNYATLAAYDEVLAKTPNQSEFRGITGALRSRLPDLAKISPRLREFFSGRPGPLETSDQMADLLRARAVVFNLWTRAYNVARIELGDLDRDKRRDWFGPYKIAQAIFCEFAYRRELGMRPNIPSADRPGDGVAEWALYGEFEKVVLEGHIQPRLVWESRWESLLHYPCPLAGVEF